MSDVKEVLKKLVESMKDQGLEILEDQSEKVALAVFDWLEDLAAQSENKVDDLVVSFITGWKDDILLAIDKIDGEVDEKEEATV